MLLLDLSRRPEKDYREGGRERMDTEKGDKIW